MGRERSGSADTSMGGSAEDFPKTTYHLVLGLRGESPDDRRRALERLGRRYWKPVYAFARRAWAKSNEDAKDLTQAFFLWMLEAGRLAKYDAARGTFRGYLKLLLKGFVADREDALRALKRGGGVRILAIPESGDLEPAALDRDPQDAFDRHWKLEILKRALRRVRQWFTAAGREVQFQAFSAYAEAEKEGRPTYAEVARRLGRSESDVRNYLHAVRRRLREEMKAELADTVAGPDDLEAEWQALFSRA